MVLPILAASGLQVGPGLFPGLQSRAGRPGQPALHRADDSQGRGRYRRPPAIELAELLYGQAVVRVVPVSNCEVAEACKILENTYRSVNIAMVNELKMLFDRLGIDIWEVIEAAKTKPFGFQAFYPGPGPGRALHPHRPLLPELGGPEARHDHALHRAGRRDQHQHAAVRGPAADRRARTRSGKPVRGSKVCVLGVAYKKDVDDPRESPSFELMELLLAGGAVLSYNDPHIPRLPSMRHYRLPDDGKHHAHAGVPGRRRTAC